MNYCLPKPLASKLLDALKDGSLDLDALSDMKSSDARRAAFEPHVGKENAQHVNALFEKTFLLKDQQRGLETWVKNLVGVKKSVRDGLLTKIEKMTAALTPSDEHGFMADLAESAFGAPVTEDEAKNIVAASQKIGALKEAWNDDTQKWSSEDARLQFGAAHVEFQNYVGGLKRGAKSLSFTEWLKSPSKWWGTVAGVTKGVVASFDNSFFGRQGMKMLLTNPDIWSKSFVKSWGDIGKELVKVDAMAIIKADIFSRPNAMNGKYRAGKYALGIDTEEAFPSALPEHVPILGRIYKASESAFNGAALRMRADLADRYIKAAEETGVDMTDSKQAEGIGSLVNAMTGRGNISLPPKAADAINSTFFSLRFLKANYDTLTLHGLGTGFNESAGPGRDFARKKAAENLLKIIAGIAGVLTTANLLSPGSADLDPRSADFGKIKIGETRFDVTGGMGSLVTLAARLVPTLHNGHWGLWMKSSTTGKWTDLREGKYGHQTALDVVNNFWEGKLAPAAGALRDLWKGKVFGGAPATPGNIAKNMFVPMPVQTFMDAEANPHSAPLLAIMILDGLGISSNTYQPKHPKH